MEKNNWKRTVLVMIEKVTRQEVEKNASKWPPLCNGIYHQPKRPGRGKYMIGLLLACSVAFSTPVMASEDTSINLTENEKEQDMAQITGGEMLDLFSDEENNQLDTMAVPDKWEPNNTLETAYPYDKLPVLTTTITCSTDLYRLGMRYGSLDSPDDVDWYTVDLTANQKYFVDLRNVGETNWYIELYYSDGKNRCYYTTNPSEKPVYEKKPEKYLSFTAEYTGTYYIKIANGGDWVDDMDYFFYVGPVTQYFDLELPTGSTTINGNGYRTYICNLKNQVVPAHTSIVKMAIVDNFPNGNVCTEVDKYMMAGGRTYYNRTGYTEIQGMAGESLGQLWFIGGKCASSEHFTRWGGTLIGRFQCEMETYPGNELDLQ